MTNNPGRQPSGAVEPAPRDVGPPDDASPVPPPQSQPAETSPEAVAPSAISEAIVELWEPQVKMSEAHAATCLVRVGDTMPDFELPDLDGTTRRLASLRGKDLTVVVFWNAQFVFAREQYARLIPELVEPYREAGVHVVAVNVGDDPETVRRLTPRTADALVSLLDTDERVFAQVAKGKLPRTYVLDKTGKILWMDLEYSRATRRELENALRYYLNPET